MVLILAILGVERDDRDWASRRKVYGVGKLSEAY